MAENRKYEELLTIKVKTDEDSNIEFYFPGNDNWNISFTEEKVENSPLTQNILLDNSDTVSIIPTFKSIRLKYVTVAIEVGNYSWGLKMLNVSIDPYADLYIELPLVPDDGVIEVDSTNDYDPTKPIRDENNYLAIVSKHRDGKYTKTVRSEERKLLKAENMDNNFAYIYPSEIRANADLFLNPTMASDLTPSSHIYTPPGPQSQIPQFTLDVLIQTSSSKSVILENSGHQFGNMTRSSNELYQILNGSDDIPISMGNPVMMNINIGAKLSPVGIFCDIEQSVNIFKNMPNNLFISVDSSMSVLNLEVNEEFSGSGEITIIANDGIYKTYRKIVFKTISKSDSEDVIESDIKIK